MPKTKVTVKGLTAKLEQMAAPIDKNSAKLAGIAAVEEMKRLIASGQSTIQGSGRFPSYKESYVARIKSSYQSRYRKTVRPINLKLTGDFLSNLTSKIVSRGTEITTEVGFYDNLSKLKEQGHREGANGQKERPIIPNENERFSASVRKAVADIYRGRISALAKKLSKE